VGAGEVGEPDASVPLGLEAADGTGDFDSGARFGPAGTGRDLRTCGGAGELADPVAPADGDVAVVESVADESVDDESVDDESVDVDPVSSAHATPIPRPVATAAPTPRATASAPTRPMYFAYPMVAPAAGPAVCAGLGFADEEATVRVAAAGTHE
jgi:hypothetical protein